MSAYGNSARLSELVENSRWNFHQQRVFVDILDAAESLGQCLDSLATRTESFLFNPDTAEIHFHPYRDSLGS